MSSTAPASAQPASPPDASGQSIPTGRSDTGRLIGIDLARALAVFGMYAVHVGPPASAVAGPGGWLIGFSEGRASALFALLAGFSVMFIAGRREPTVGRAMRQAKGRILLRAAVLLIVGTAMTMVVGDVVILNYYAVYFLLTLPLLRLGARSLIVVATILALVSPLLRLGLVALLTPDITGAVNAVDPLKLLSGVGVLDLFVTGFYPAVTWMTFVVAGMALARLDLASTAVRVRAAIVGAGLMLVGYGIPWLLAQILGGSFKEMHDAPSGRSAEGAMDKAGWTDKAGWADQAGSADKTFSPGIDGDAWMTQLLAQPHSGSTFDLVGCIGIAILVILACLTLMQGPRLVSRALTPFVAVGTMSLTAYVGHFMIPVLFGFPLGSSTSVIPLLLFIGTVTVFAFVWSRFFRRGPLEQLLHVATLPAARIR